MRICKGDRVNGSWTPENWLSVSLISACNLLGGPRRRNETMDTRCSRRLVTACVMRGG
jgi:hypothetical protein